MGNAEFPYTIGSEFQAVKLVRYTSFRSLSLDFRLVKCKEG